MPAQRSLRWPVMQVGFTQVSEDPVSRARVMFCGGVPMPTIVVSNVVIEEFDGNHMKSDIPSLGTC